MLKKIFFIVLLFNLLNHCEYKPVYSNQNNQNYKIIINNFSGDKEINNQIVTNLTRFSKEESDEVINISFNTEYEKNILAKNTAGTITNYQSNLETKFIITKNKYSKNLSLNEKFNFQKMTDKYEEKNYERNIKKNLANSVSQKLILKLALIE